jgi:hypothetical protein
MANGVLFAVNSTLQHQYASAFKFGLYQIQVDIQRAPYTFTKKRGLFGGFHDSGLIDLNVARGGLCLRGKIAVDPRNAEAPLSLVWSKVALDKVAVRLYRSKHPILTTLLQPTIVGQIRKHLKMVRGVLCG